MLQHHVDLPAHTKRRMRRRLHELIFMRCAIDCRIKPGPCEPYGAIQKRPTEEGCERRTLRIIHIDRAGDVDRSACCPAARLARPCARLRAHKVVLRCNAHPAPQGRLRERARPYNSHQETPPRFRPKAPAMFRLIGPRLEMSSLTVPMMISRMMRPSPTSRVFVCTSCPPSLWICSSTWTPPLPPSIFFVSVLLLARDGCPRWKSSCPLCASLAMSRAHTPV